jgi:effector-binding domain-containing protein
MTHFSKCLLPVLAAAIILGCNEGGNTKAPTAKDSDSQTADTIPVQKPATADARPDGQAQRPPIINIIDTLSVAKTVLCMKDSAASVERVGMKLALIYGEKLGKCLADNKMTMAGPPMAWYKTQKPPFFFEAGVPVSKRPGKLPAGAFIKELPAGNVIIARFFGPYDQLGMAYETVNERLKASKTTAIAPPYEIYIGDPEVQKDPYKVQTDVVFPVKAPAKQ